MPKGKKIFLWTIFHLLYIPCLITIFKIDPHAINPISIKFTRMIGIPLVIFVTLFAFWAIKLGLIEMWEVKY
jgi:hypothetical protein